MKTFCWVLASLALAACSSSSPHQPQGQESFSVLPESFDTRSQQPKTSPSEAGAGAEPLRADLSLLRSADRRATTSLSGATPASDQEILEELLLESEEDATSRAELAAALESLTLSVTRRAWKAMNRFLNQGRWNAAAKIAPMALRVAPHEALAGTGGQSGLLWRVVPASAIFGELAAEDHRQSSDDDASFSPDSALNTANFLTALLQEVAGEGSQVFSGEAAAVVVASADSLALVGAFLGQRAATSPMYGITFEYVVVDANHSPFADDLKTLETGPVLKDADEIAALVKDGTLHRISAPRLTVLDGQQAELTIANTISYVSGYEFLVVAEGVVADPVVDVFHEGLHVGARVTAGLNGGVFAAIEALDVHQVTQAIPEYEVQLWNASTVTVQAPTLRKARGSTLASIELGKTYLLKSRLKVVWTDDSRHDAFLLFRIHQTNG